MILAWVDFILWLTTPPVSIWFIFGVSILVSLFSTFLNKVLVDHDKMNRLQEVINNHKKRKKELLQLSEDNPKKYANEYPKWQRRDPSIKKMEQRMSLQKIKPGCFTLLPIFIFFAIIRTMFTLEGSSMQFPVACGSMNPMQEFPVFITSMLQSEMYSVLGNIVIDHGFIGFTGWYMLCSFTVSTIINKIFKVTRSSNGQGMGSMFDAKAQEDLPDPKSLL
ncbi:EMC3/TMCO1 family protein [Promethearchaeum syntrophicum]|uniref:EMC3/TMCO1 family protein n=1 Tax=Promethearchaeum syntrophicum TaxID=2594042 RepID=A0A5B9DF16_9ARCH|nr:EMC3/TMCO1 family protein [Candidatus Prometheoarchaeum syntrophicum]